VTTLTEGTWLRVIMAILIVVSSGLSTECERAEAAKPVATGPHEVKVLLLLIQPRPHEWLKSIDCKTAHPGSIPGVAS
jgi:hypothetical protein